VNQDRSARYHALGRRAAIASTAWSACYLSLLSFTPLSSWLPDSLDRLLAPVVPAWFLPSALVLGYVGICGAVHELGESPIAFYRTFLLEHRYGLSTESLRLWLVDLAKSAALGGGLSLAGFWALYAIVRRWPHQWWLIAALGFAAVVTVLTRLAPVVLMPIFFTFRPLAREGLRERLLALSEKAGVPAADACEWQLSDRTKKANAALAGFGGTRRILLSDTLLAGYSDDEIEVILAHELAHQVHHDVWRGLAAQTFVVGTGLFAASRVMAVASPRLGWHGVADVAGLPVLLLAAGLVSVVMMPAANAASRAMERAADRFALAATGNAAAFQSAMRRLADQNLSEEHPSRFARWMFYTHPPVKERIAAAERWQRHNSQQATVNSRRSSVNGL
jgi:STE24 endopeptidase